MTPGEIIEYVRDRWEWDSAWKNQILLTVIVGGISLGFVVVEMFIRNSMRKSVSVSLSAE